MSVLPASLKHFGLASAALVVTAVAYLCVPIGMVVHEHLSLCGAYCLYGTTVHASQTFVALAMVIGTHIVALVPIALVLACANMSGRGAVGCYGAYRPRTGDDSMCLQQFHRAVGIHLAGDNRAQVVLQVDGVDGSLCTVRMVQNMQFTGKLLVFASVPMKTYADANILEEKTSVLLFPLNVGCC